MYVGLILPLKKLSAKEVSRFRDSKKLSERQREECFTAIQQLQEKGKLIAFSAFATVQEIDKYGMTNAEHMAIVRGLRIILNNPLLTSFAVPLTGDKTVKNGSFIECVLSPCQGRGRSEATEEGLSNVHLVIDGKSDFNLQKIYPSLEITTIIHGDDKVKEI
ncbi:MAG: hypothetical protein LBO09_02975 [Candidatus Peribacteria bacterium]|jgi:hypothetical protein|nr:hypothetical protein [Candidatus Peribacteria bacterium]